MSRVTTRDKVQAWREKYLGEVTALSGRISVLVGDAKKIRADAARVFDRIVQSAEKMRWAVEQGAEDRKSEIYAALVKKHGEAAAEAMLDQIDTSREDERDEATCGQLDELPVPDPDDAMSQAIESLEALEDELGELLSGIRGVR